MLSFQYNGIVGLLILIADIYAIVSIGGSRESTLSKVIWIVLVLVLPVLGFLLWLLFGPKSRR